MLQFTIKHKWISAFAINLFLFVAVNIFLLPIFNSGDDVFLLYTLSGGFGDAPTNLLHYNYGWHPALGWLAKSLYEKWAGINWYGFILVLLQLKASVVFLYLLFKKFRAGNALLLYLIFFCFIEIRILLSLNFSTTAWITAAAGFVLLLEGTRLKRNIFYIISGTILILIAGLLRLHILIAVAILLAPVLFIYARNEFKVWGSVIVLAAGLLFLLNIQHKNYYKKNIPGWEKQEAYRQVLFKLSNRSENALALNKVVYIDSTELAFYKAKFFIDTGFISKTKLEQLSKNLKEESRFSVKDLTSGLYWLFIELRVYLLLLSICLFILWKAGWLKPFIRDWITPLLIVAGAYLFLSIFLKMNFTLHMGFMVVLWIYSFEVLAISRPAFGLSKIRSGLFILLLLPFTWIGLRIYKTDTDNRIKHDRFKCLVSELQKHSEKLFIATDDLLPMPFCSIWDVPSKNRISNLIYKDRLIAGIYASTLEKYEITDLPVSVFTNTKVFLIGTDIPALSKYLEGKYGINTELRLINETFDCFKVRKANCIGGCEKYLAILNKKI